VDLIRLTLTLPHPSSNCRTQAATQFSPMHESIDLGKRIDAAEARVWRQKAHLRWLRAQGHCSAEATALLKLMMDALTQMREVESALRHYRSSPQPK